MVYRNQIPLVSNKMLASLVCLSLLSLYAPSTVFLVPSGTAEQKDPGPVTPPYLKLPATKTVKLANRNFYLKPDTNCASIKWIIPTGLEQDTEVVLKDKLAVALYGPDGTYTVMAYGTLGDQLTDPASCVVTIGTPPPGPGPGPNPPPNPPDALTQAIQTAYTQDMGAEKASYVKTLSTLYSTAATTTVDDASLTTLGDLFKVLKQAGDSLLPTTAIPKTRAAISTYLTKQLGTTATDPIDRTKAKSAFAAVSAALAAVK